MDPDTRAEARSAEEGEEEDEAEAEVQASEFEEGLVDSVSNIQMEVEDEHLVETIASQHSIPAIAAAEERGHHFSPRVTDGASHEHTPGRSTLSGRVASAAPGPALGLTEEKQRVMCGIRKHMAVAELFLGEYTLELEALEADLSFRETEAICRGMNLELTSDEALQKILRHQLVAAASTVKANNGRVYECSLRRFDRQLGRRPEMMAMEDHMMVSESLLENMDIDSASLSVLLKIESRVLRLEFEALKLNGD